MNIPLKRIASFALILVIGSFPAFTLNAELRAPSSLVPKKLHETPKSYQNRQRQIEKFRSNAEYFLRSDQPTVTGPHLGSNYDPFKKFRKSKAPSKQNCLNALGNLVAAANAGDFESAMILGEIYETGRLLGLHTIPVDQNWAVVYYNMAWDICCEANNTSRITHLKMAAGFKVKSFSDNGNLYARHFSAVAWEKEGDDKSRVRQFASAIDAYSTSLQLERKGAVQAKIEEYLPHAVFEAERFGNDLLLAKQWYATASKSPDVMMQAAEIAHTAGETGPAIRLAKVANRNGSPAARPFIADTSMDLANKAETNKDFALAKIYAREAEQFGSVQAQGYIERMDLQETMAMIGNLQFGQANAMIAKLKNSKNPDIRAQAKAMGDKLGEIKPQNGVQVYRRIKGSVFRIETNKSTGSGFVVADGIIASNVHVIKGATSATAIQISTGKKFAVNLRPYAADFQRDLVLLRVNFNGPSPRPLPLKPIGKVQIGETAYALGNPHGLSGNFSKGSVTSKQKFNSSKLRLSAGKPGDVIIVTDTSINPGNSGGPLVDNKGWVIGVNTYHITKGDLIVDDGLNFAISAQYVKELLR